VKGGRIEMPHPNRQGLDHDARKGRGQSIENETHLLRIGLHFARVGNEPLAWNGKGRMLDPELHDPFSARRFD
jgi:hypothetical protein